MQKNHPQASMNERSDTPALPDTPGGPIPEVSVLMTCYNRAAYIAEAIESVLASTYRDWELIIVDDRSADDSFEIARDYAERDPRVRVFRNEKNLGDYPNRNRAAALARGEYLKYLDADDLLYPHGLGVMVEAMKRFPEAALGIGSNRPEEDFPYPFSLSPAEVYRREYLGKRENVLRAGPSATIIRRDAFELEKGFQVPKHLGDIELWYRLAKRHPVVVLPPALIWWRKHEAQQCRAPGRDLYRLRAGFAIDTRLLTAEDCPLPPADRRTALRRVRRRHARKILALALKKNRPGAAWRLFRESGLTMRELLTGFRPHC
jgi:glycosyltransferase involved in cell wall biosynthesis